MAITQPARHLPRRLAPRSAPGSSAEPGRPQSALREQPPPAAPAPPRLGTRATHRPPPRSPTAATSASSSPSRSATCSTAGGPRSSTSRPAPTAPAPGRSPLARSAAGARSPAAPPWPPCRTRCIGSAGSRSRSRSPRPPPSAGHEPGDRAGHARAGRPVHRLVELPRRSRGTTSAGPLPPSVVVAASP